MGTKFATSLVKGKEGYEVGREAAMKALKKLGSDKVDLSIVFSSAKYKYRDVVKGIREITKNAPLIGCSAGGEFTEDGTEKGGVACALISSDTHKFQTGLGLHLRENVINCIKDAVKDFPKSIENYPNLSYILCADGLAGKGDEIVKEMVSLLGKDVKFAGGCAGDDLIMRQTMSFIDDNVFSNAISLALIASKKPVIIAVQYGHYPISPSLTVTKSENNVVYELNGKPAFEVWKEYAGDRAKISLNIDVDKLQERTEELANFFTYFEAGIFVEGEGYKIRWPGATTVTDGRMVFSTAIPEGTILKVMSSSKEDQIAVARRSSEMILNSLKGEKLAGIIVFDCVVRAVILQEEFRKAIGIIGEILKVPMIGFETYGEYAMEAEQMKGFHNTTTVILAIPD